MSVNLYTASSNNTATLWKDKSGRYADPVDWDAWWLELRSADSGAREYLNIDYCGFSYYIDEATPPTNDYYYMKIARGIIRFDTSDIPEDAVITDVKLSLYVYNVSDNFGNSVIIQEGTSCDYPFEQTDYNRTKHTGNYGSKTLASMPDDDWVDISLDVSIVNKGGNTLIVLKDTADYNDARPDEEGSSWFQYNYVTSGLIPKLYVTIQDEPTVTTNTATEIGYDCAMGNGEITSGTNASERGFDYYIDGDSGNVLSVNEEGDFAEGTYALEIEGLNSNTKYWYRAKAKIDGVWTYGDYVEFTTEPITLATIKADRQGHLAKIRLYGEIL